MPIPGYQSLMLPVLVLASDGEIHAANEAIEALASKFEVTAEERNEPLPSGRGLLFYNRVVTTSSYAPAARDWVTKIDKSIVLIDGADLAKHMVDHEIGVQRRAEFRLYRVDDDFFEVAD